MSNLGYRVSSSVALKTNDIWSKTIGHDPYANDAEKSRLAEEEGLRKEQSNSIMLLAKMSKVSGSDNRGGCKICGALGHLTFQCRNKLISVPSVEKSSDDSSSDSDSDSDESSSLCQNSKLSMEKEAEVKEKSRKRKHSEERKHKKAKKDHKEKERKSKHKNKRSRKEKKSRDY